jgi:hypothetical protein
MKVSTINPIFVFGFLFGTVWALLARLGTVFCICLEAVCGAVIMPLASGIEDGEKLVREAITPRVEEPDEV